MVGNLTINDTFKSSLSNDIKNEYNKLIKILDQVPLKYMSVKAIEGCGGKISVRDLIAYQIGWGNLLIAWYESGIKQEEFAIPGEGFSKWDYIGLANHFYNKYHFDSVNKQILEFHKTVQTIIYITEKEYQKNNLDKLEVWHWCTLPSGKQWPLSKWIKVNTYSPYKKAAALIRKFFKK